MDGTEPMPPTPFQGGGAMRRARMLTGYGSELAPEELEREKKRVEKKRRRDSDADGGNHHGPPQRARVNPSLAFDFEDDEIGPIHSSLVTCLALREKYCPLNPAPLEDVEPNPLPPYARSPESLWAPTLPPDMDLDLRFHRGVMRLNGPEDKLNRCSLYEVPDYAEYIKDYAFVLCTANYGPVRTFSWRRLELLKAHFRMHKMENSEEEAKEQRNTPGPRRDLLSVMKVDNHVHHAASMNQQDLLDFIRHKMLTEADVVVQKAPDGTDVTLGMILERHKLNHESLSLDSLEMQIDSDYAYNRFDRFNKKYNPFGYPTLRELFLKTSNHMNGRYFAELTKQCVFKALEERPGLASEYRLSIYGRSRGEWDALAHWVVSNQLFSPRNRWMIQVPRLYSVYRKKKLVKNFQEMLGNVFAPLIEVTLRPQSHPELFAFLQQVVGVDSVDDESKDESEVKAKRLAKDTTPDMWTFEDNPEYNYYLFYFWANLEVLNRLRRQRGLNEIAFRPHCGEAGDHSHLITGFLLSDAINHGIQLHQTPVMQYLYYLAQIPISMSPISNNALFMPFSQSPFLSFFQKGLNMSLSTDDPCLFHFTRQPLMEEFSIIAKICRLTSCDMCELARNSVYHSGFEPCVKAEWLGRRYQLLGVRGNAVGLSNVPNKRLLFRRKELLAELELIHFHTGPSARMATVFNLHGSPIPLSCSRTSSADLSPSALRRIVSVPPFQLEPNSSSDEESAAGE